MSSRLWFRVEDVLPLAEHALACPTHRLTRAQLMAGEHNTPALTLRHLGADGHLRSNGLPIWCSRDGDEHVAHGRSWRCVDATAAPEMDLYLPLRHAGPDGRRLIDVLRAARTVDRHWLAITTDIWPGCTIDTSHIEVSDHRAEIAPPDTRWRPGMVTAPRLGGRYYPALVADGHAIGEDGQLICRLHPRTMRQLAADLGGPWRAGTLPGEHPLVRFDGVTAVLLEETDTGDAVRLDVDDRCYPDRDGYYSIGADRWLWHTSTTVAVPLPDRLRLHLAALPSRLRAHRRQSRSSPPGPR
ncbi:hypothetical protein [Micromonospora sp. NPDC092111]|uniref:hypothetical protein n=1 Tax=Micromonospora sp. NPDC092111 TaxID=3364289 RepID=UPI00382C2933